MRPPPAVKRIVGLLCPPDDEPLLSRTREELMAEYGPFERESEPYPFLYTDYYRDISPNLERRFFSFCGLVSPNLVAWKHRAMAIEERSACSGAARRVNVDPGYLDGARLVLASTKDNAHRVYLADGIFAEVTLCRRKSGWEHFSYTFPDFAAGVYDAFLDAVRCDWRNDIRNTRRNG